MRRWNCGICAAVKGIVYICKVDIRNSEVYCHAGLYNGAVGRGIEHDLGFYGVDCDAVPKCRYVTGAVVYVYIHNMRPVQPPRRTDIPGGGKAPVGCTSVKGVVHLCYIIPHHNKIQYGAVYNNRIVHRGGEIDKGPFDERLYQRVIVLCPANDINIWFVHYAIAARLILIGTGEVVICALARLIEIAPVIAP